LVRTKHSFIFNSKSSLDYGIIIATHPESRHAERRGSTSTIPGRHGALYRDEAAFSTYEISYDVLLDARNVVDMYHLGRDLSAWLLTASGYCRLEDTYEPEHYRMARYVGSPDVANILFKFGRAELEFEVQPQRYLKSGEKEIEITEEITTLRNPTAFAASPLIKVEMQSEAQEITPTVIGADDMTWSYGYIGNKRMNPSLVHTVIQSSYTNCSVSNAIDVSGMESAVITTECFRSNPYDVRESWGLGMATCYTFYTSAGKPVSKVVDYQKMESVTIPVPKNAKWLYICVANNSSGRIMEPSVTLNPALPSAGTGSVTINGKQATIEFADRSVIYLDCEAHNAFFEDGSNANSAVTFMEDGNTFPTFPTIDPGENQISMSASADAEITVSIVPRWWQL